VAAAAESEAVHAAEKDVLTVERNALIAEKNALQGQVDTLEAELTAVRETAARVPLLLEINEALAQHVRDLREEDLQHAAATDAHEGDMKTLKRQNQVSQAAAFGHNRASRAFEDQCKTLRQRLREVQQKYRNLDRYNAELNTELDRALVYINAQARHLSKANDTIKDLRREVEQAAYPPPARRVRAGTADGGDGRNMFFENGVPYYVPWDLGS